MRRPLFLVAILGWMLLLAGCAGGKLTLSSPNTFQISAVSSTVRVDETLQLSATTTGPVAWLVNGVPGGSSVFGTIDANGLYRAPASLPANNVVTISAEAAGAEATTPLTLWNPVPVIASVSSREVANGLELTIGGSKFVSGAVVNFGGSLYPATSVSSTSLKATVPASSAAAPSVQVAVSNPDPGAAFSESMPFSLNRPSRPPRGSNSLPAARLLDQATFGTSAADVAAINQLRTNLGNMPQAMSQWIDDQINPAVTLPSSWPDIPSPIPVNPNNAQPLCGNPMLCVQILWYQNALSGSDQLRQRTAFALSQIWVVSGNTVQVSDSYLPYYRILNDRAFGNYLQIMDEITRSSAMGFYLDMGNSAKPASGSIANENYARELLQLFTVGLYMLNDDGTYQVNGNGQFIPTYTEEQVQAFARALTGWTYARNDGQAIWNQSFTAGTTNRRVPMVAVASQHDLTQKDLLTYPGAVSAVLSANNTAQQDLDGALANIFNHPNLPPFVSKQLIQHLVTSNPSPEYVGRVTAVFKNNGNNVRGDMAAVIKAILLDPEARQADTFALTDHHGHLREPALYVTGILRSLGFTNVSTLYTSTGGSMSNLGLNLGPRARDMGQNVLFSPSVFNYFAPNYSIQSGSLLGPEFQLQTTANATIRANFADSVVRNTFTSSGIDVSASLTALANVAANADQLIDQLDQKFTHGQMSAAMKQSILTKVNALPSATSSDRTFRVRVALYLVISSSQYQVLR
jgi:uncharacterized protein (DUF1800 family)